VSACTRSRSSTDGFPLFRERQDTAKVVMPARHFHAIPFGTTIMADATFAIVREGS